MKIKLILFFVIFSFLFSSLFAQECVPRSILSSDTGNPSCPFQSGVQRIDRRQSWAVSYGSSPGRIIHTSDIGQCFFLGSYCPAEVDSPEVGSIYWRQRWVGKYVRNEGGCGSFSETIYRQPPDGCTNCGRLAGVRCQGNECESNLLNCSESNEQEIIACLAQCRIWNASGFCEPFRPGECASEQAGCNCSPIVIDIAGNGFNLTKVTNGVDFDLNGDGIINSRIAWTSTNSDDAWLALDRNQNGTIENGQELFGNFTLQPESNEKNGFLALAEFDKVANGGNADGNITNSDSVFNSLRLWQDANRNGISEANELKTLQSHNIMKLELDYRESKKTDEHGNHFKYRAKVKDGNNAQVGRWAWDVFLQFENY